MNRQLDTSHSWHHHIRDNEIWRGLVASGDRFLGLIEGDSIKTGPFQNEGEGRGDYGFIVHDKDNTFSVRHHISLGPYLKTKPLVSSLYLQVVYYTDNKGLTSDKSVYVQ